MWLRRAAQAGRCVALAMIRVVLHLRECQPMRFSTRCGIASHRPLQCSPKVAPRCVACTWHGTGDPRSGTGNRGTETGDLGPGELGIDGAGTGERSPGTRTTVFCPLVPAHLNHCFHLYPRILTRSERGTTVEANRGKWRGSMLCILFWEFRLQEAL
jgi:hypothetical protein